jgi:hypothetical protein
MRSGEFARRGSTSALIDGSATGSLSTFPYFILHNWHTHPSSKYLRSVHTLTEGPSLLGFPQSARTSAALSSARRARRQAIPSCRPQGPGCCSSHPRTNGKSWSARPEERRGYLKCPPASRASAPGPGAPASRRRPRYRCRDTTGAVRATPKARLASARTVPPPGLLTGAWAQLEGPQTQPGLRRPGRQQRRADGPLRHLQPEPVAPGHGSAQRPTDARRRPVAELSPESLANRAGRVVRRVGSRATRIARAELHGPWGGWPTASRRLCRRGRQCGRRRHLRRRWRRRLGEVGPRS